MSDAEPSLSERLTAASEQPMASASPGELQAIRDTKGWTAPTSSSTASSGANWRHNRSPWLRR